MDIPGHSYPCNEGPEATDPRHDGRVGRGGHILRQALREIVAQGL
ncbi:MAG: hypothetical protein ACR652_06810 [Methylocystis sp.]